MDKLGKLGRRVLTILLAVVMVCGVAPLGTVKVEAGDVPAGYTPIYTAQGLDNVRNNLNGKYILMMDIDLSSWGNWEPIGDTNSPFTGTFEGNGKTIANLSLLYNDKDLTRRHFGLFAKSSGNIANLMLKSVIINVKFYQVSYCSVGSICGENYGGTISGCQVVSGSIVGQALESSGNRIAAGGICGSQTLSRAKIENCINAATIQSDWRTGGIVGDNEQGGNIICSYNTGAITGNAGTIGNYVTVGGICGYMSGNSTVATKIENCYNTGIITAVSSYPNSPTGSNPPLTCAGGICGMITRGSSNKKVSIEKSFSKGTISSSSTKAVAAGICGYVDDEFCEIVSCVSLVKQIVSNSSLTPMGSYLIASGANKTNNVALENIEGSPTADTELFVTATMSKQKNTYTNIGWDFDIVWSIDPAKNGGYPFLRGVTEPTTSETLALAELRETFPAEVDGQQTYWNHPRMLNGTNIDNGQDSYTFTQCSHLGTTADGVRTDTYTRDCNGFDPTGTDELSWQCKGFAEKLAYDYYRSNPNITDPDAAAAKTETIDLGDWEVVKGITAKSYVTNGLKAGDIIRTYETAAYNHSRFVIGVVGDTIYFADCNINGVCDIRWDAKITKNAVNAKLFYVQKAPYAMPDAVTLLRNETKGVEVYGSLSSDTVLTVEDVAVSKWPTLNDYLLVQVYDINLLKDGQKIQPSGNVTVSIKVGSEIAGTNPQVCYIDGEGSATIINARVNGEYIEFETDHFSVYGIAIEDNSHTHTYNSQITTQPTCIKAGVTTFTCVDGDHSYTQALPSALGHSFSVKQNTITPTYEEQGYTIYKCSRCTVTEKRDYVEKLTRPTKGIFGTNAKWYGAWWHYVLFFIGFGFIWMWF